MFSKFSLASRGVLRAAEQECRNHNHYYVGSEHVLLALLEENDPAIVARFAAAQVTGSELHAELRRALGTGEERTWEGILVTPRLRKVVELAQSRAADADVQPIDLFDAILEEGGGLAGDLLARAGAGRLRALGTGS